MKCELADQILEVDSRPRFKIGNLLGSGGFGVVHEGRLSIFFSLSFFDFQKLVNLKKLSI